MTKQLIFWVMFNSTSCLGAELDDARQQFNDPPLKYATRPLYFWNNAAVTEAGVTEQMQKARDLCGYGGFGILPFGKDFSPEYLSEDYFKVYGAALEKAKQLGMTMCLYDEFGFPSGSAGARNGDGVPRFANKYPAHTLKRLDKIEADVKGPGPYIAPIPADGRLMSIVAMDMDSKQIVNLADQVQGNTLRWSAPAGRWKVLMFMCVKDGSPLVDYLDPEACVCFVAMTHQAYYDRFQEHFGTTIDGAFFDEPTMYHAQGRVWTGNFNEKFKAKHGFEPDLLYPALWYDIGPRTQAARNYLFGLRAELYAAAFTKVIQDWCTEHGIAATGHQDQEEVVNPVSVSGDLMLCFKYLDIPGVDRISPGDKRPARRFYKVISSAAYNWDKALVMSETYGAMGDIEWEEIYRVAMEQYTKGINQLIPHAVWYDDTHVTFKPELSWRHDKYADGLPQFNRYMSRLNVLLQNHGRHVADIAMLYPIAAMQAGHHFEYTLSAYAGGVTIPEADYVVISELLSTQVGHDFTYLHPEVLTEQCVLQGSTLLLPNEINREAYRMVIMPAHETISWQNLKKIKAFYDQGGQVIATGTLPSKSAEFGHDADVAEAIKAMFPGVPQDVPQMVTATASSFWPGYDAANIVDGSLETRWNAENGKQEQQWLEIDFGDKLACNRVEIHELFDRVTAYRIQYWDGRQWGQLHSGSQLGNKKLTFETVQTTKLRLCLDSVASDTASIAEFAAFLDDANQTLRNTPHVVNRNSNGGTTVFMRKPNADSLRNVLDRMLDVYDVAFPPGQELRYIHKVVDGKDVYFFANLCERPINTTVTLKGRLVPELWDPHTGVISNAEYTHEEVGSVTVTKVVIALDPTKSIFVVGR